MASDVALICVACGQSLGNRYTAATNIYVRFFEKIKKTDNCWLWQATIIQKGYGQFWHPQRKMMVPAHRFSYEIFRGRISEGLEIDHLCGVRSCVRPDHLEAVSKQENIRRSDAGGPQRRRTHCPQGHPYDEANTYRPPNRNERLCRLCRKERESVRC